MRVHADADVLSVLGIDAPPPPEPDPLVAVRIPTRKGHAPTSNDPPRGRFIAALDHDGGYLDRVVLLHTAGRASVDTTVAGESMRFGTARAASYLAPDALGTDAAWYPHVELAHGEAPA